MERFRGGIAGLLAAATLTATACESDVRPADYSAADESASAQWQISDEPDVVIGSEDSPEYALHLVGNAVALSSGDIVVANAQSELRYYDAEGRHRRTSGRRGEGPGEFRQLWTISALAGDSVAAFNTYPPYIAIFDSSGQYVRMINLEVQPSTLFSTANGEWVGSRTRMGDGFDDTPRVVRRQVELLRYSSEGAVAASLGNLDGARFFRTARNVRGAPFTTSASLALGKQRLYATSGDRYEIRVHTLDDGRVEDVIRGDIPRRQVTDQMIEDYRREREAAATGARTRERGPGGVAPRVPEEEPPFPETLPAISKLLVDSEGYLWARRFYVESDPAEIWDVFDRNGNPVATLEVPRALRIVEIGRDYVLGVWTDEWDVQSVRQYSLER